MVIAQEKSGGRSETIRGGGRESRKEYKKNKLMSKSFLDG